MNKASSLYQLISAPGLILCLVLTTHTTADDAKLSTTDPVQIQPSSIDSPLPKGVDEKTGFRMNRYRAPVPDVNPGAEVVNTRRAIELHASGQVKFIDVYPPKGLGADPLNGNWMTNEKHQSMEGATWLPEVGRGHIEQGHVDYFQRNLKKITGDDKQTPLMFYCTADCWQSWNAARRALLWGYENILWYPAGTDGWQEHNQPLYPIEPVNFLGE